MDTKAPDGAVWVCAACGKRASDRFEGGISRGWDESCMLNACLCVVDSLVFSDDGNRVMGATALKAKP